MVDDGLALTENLHLDAGADERFPERGWRCGNLYYG